MATRSERTDESQAESAGPPTDDELAEVRRARRASRDGTVLVVVQDGVIVQIDRTDKRRFAHRSLERRLILTLKLRLGDASLRRSGFVSWLKMLNPDPAPAEAGASKEEVTKPELGNQKNKARLPRWKPGFSRFGERPSSGTRRVRLVQVFQSPEPRELR